MILYLLISITPLVFGLIFSNLKTKGIQRTWFFVLCGFLLILFMGLRNKSLGSADSYNYYVMMEKAIKSRTWLSYYDKEGTEIGFQLFTWLLSRVFRDPQWILIISSIIYVVCLLNFISRNSKDPALSLTMYITLGLMTFELQGMRQSIAMSVCLIAYEFVKSKKFIPFVLLVALAMTFHRSAIVFIAVYFIGLLKFKPIHLILYIVVLLVAIFSADSIIRLANDIFDRNYYNTVESGGFIATAIYVLCIVFTLIATKRPVKDNINVTMFYLLLLGFACYIVRYFGALAVERISFYFMFSQLIILPNAIADGRFETKDKSVIKIIVYLLCILLFAYRLIGSEFVPYMFFWN